MEFVVQAVVLGLIQGLTEFLPISSSGHLIVVPYLMGWRDPFITSLPFAVMLHLGTLGALLGYFWRDWLRLVPAAAALVLDRSTRGDHDRRLASLLGVATVPALVAGALLNDAIEDELRGPALVALMLVAGAMVMWLADRWGRRSRELDGLGPAAALGIGAAQALALVPGVSRSGISISAGLFVGLKADSAARFSFLMATPVTFLAGVWEVTRLLTQGAAEPVPLLPLVAGIIAAVVSGLLAIRVLLGYLRRHGLAVFVVYRVLLAALVVIGLLSR